MYEYVYVYMYIQYADEPQQICSNLLQHHFDPRHILEPSPSTDLVQGTVGNSSMVSLCTLQRCCVNAGLITVGWQGMCTPIHIAAWRVDF